MEPSTFVEPKERASKGKDISSRHDLLYVLSLIATYGHVQPNSTFTLAQYPSSLLQDSYIFWPVASEQKPGSSGLKASFGSRFWPPGSSSRQFRPPTTTFVRDIAHIYSQEISSAMTGGTSKGS